MSNINCFVIIVTFNSMKWINKCLVSLNGYKVIIVDNNSQDNTKEFISSNYSKVTLLEQVENLGFGQANNIGISFALKAGAEHIFLLNQDAYLKEGCLDILIDFQNENNEYGILSPIHLNGTGTRLDANFSNYLNYSGNKDFFSDYVLNKTLKQVYQVPFVNAAGWLLSRKCIEKVGGFDPIFFHYGEDDNYCQRVNYYGFKIGVVPNAVLFHDRENRSAKEVANADRDYFQAMERQLKLTYADINKIWDPNIDNIIRKRRNAWIKSTIKLDLKRATFFKNEYLIFKSLKSEVLLSREINKSPGLNYLNFENL
ncbi:glycosyltransferase family 2 protein [Gillisia hiemivivida]|uniref:Glycosyltransferase family 2 protein n=1 Tax=Gillisia hiemivivida TaxID=291190 RepID=A0A5C6ZUJ9_9FLAO|nr:glycosyltransferase family 2 protein [Gillisia hiemivivida]TXD93884.1 glycosyltransferase family 2 protein [Gillisia hiemivivida]